MTREEIIASAVSFTENSPANYISPEAALKPEYAGMKIFEEPMFGFCAADDDMFKELKTPGVISDEHLSPEEWLPSAKTVISFFLPLTERIRSSNTADKAWPSEEWMHGRIEGQQFVNELSLYVAKLLTDAGYKSVVPFLDERFKMGKALKTPFTSNWSERHAAYISGLGTFGLSKCMITVKGTAGRFGSVVTELELPRDTRPYTDIYEYCSMCGACAALCPVDCITLENGKVDKPCFDFLEDVLAAHKPRYGCGKCQVKVSCETKRPEKRK